MKKLVLFVLLGVVGVSILGNSTSVFADETQPEQTILLNLEQENPIDMSNPTALIIQNRDNMDGINVGNIGKIPNNNTAEKVVKCSLGIIGSGLGMIGANPFGIASGLIGAGSGCI